MNMTIAELKNSLDPKVRQLEREVEELLPSHDEAYLHALTNGLQLKSKADLFTEEERTLLGKIDELQRESFFLLEQIQSESVALIKAEKEAQGYETRIGEPIEVLRERNQQEHQEASLLVSRASNLASMAKAKGWERYEELLSKDPIRALKEAQAIVESLTIIEVIKPLPNVDTTFQFPPALRVEIDTDTYVQRVVHMTPLVFSQLDNAEQTAIIDTMLSPLLYHHRKALASAGNEGELDLAIALKTRVLTNVPATEIPEEEYESYISPTVTDVYRFTGKLINNLPMMNHNEEYKVNVKNRYHKKGKKKDKNVKTEVLVRYDDNKLSLDIVSLHNKPIDKDDVELLNAILTLWENKRQQTREETVEVVVTPQILHQRITGEPTARISKEKAWEYIERCIKLDCIRVLINAKQEAEAYYGQGAFNDDKDDPDILYGSVVNIAIHPAIINGNRVANAIHIFGFNHTPFYQYAKATGQISSTKRELLPSGVLHKNTENTRIDNYLQSRINGRNGMGNIILVSAIFEEADIDLSKFKDPKDKRRRVLGNIERLLDGYVKSGYITSWKYHARGRVNKYSIEFFTKRNKKTDAENAEPLEK